MTQINQQASWFAPPEDGLFNSEESYGEEKTFNVDDVEIDVISKVIKPDRKKDQSGTDDSGVENCREEKESGNQFPDDFMLNKENNRDYSEEAKISEDDPQSEEQCDCDECREYNEYRDGFENRAEDEIQDEPCDCDECREYYMQIHEAENHSEDQYPDSYETGDHEESGDEASSGTDNQVNHQYTDIRDTHEHKESGDEDSSGTDNHVNHQYTDSRDTHDHEESGDEDSSGTDNRLENEDAFFCDIRSEHKIPDEDSWILDGSSPPARSPVLSSSGLPSFAENFRESLSEWTEGIIVFCRKACSKRVKENRKITKNFTEQDNDPELAVIKASNNYCLHEDNSSEENTESIPVETGCFEPERRIDETYDEYEETSSVHEKISLIRAEPASLNSLALSWTIDGFLIFLLIFATIKTALIISGTSAGFSQVFLMPALFFPAAFFAAMMGATYIFAFTALYGKTPGGLLIGISVLDSRGNTPDIMTAFTRAMIASAGTLFACIGLVWILIDENGRTLHDRITDTFSVHT